MVLNDPVPFPKSDISEGLKDLILALLEKDPTRRIDWPDLALHPYIDDDDEVGQVKEEKDLDSLEFDEANLSQDSHDSDERHHEHLPNQRLDSGIALKNEENPDETLRAGDKPTIAGRFVRRMIF